MLGFQVLLVLRLECDTLCPKATPLPQILHLAILTPPKIPPKGVILYILIFDYTNRHLILYHKKSKNARVFLKKTQLFEKIIITDRI
jgi:hypothetical protein